MEIDHAKEWSGEHRMDPEDGNAYVLRKVGVATNHRGYGVIVNDIFGGHTRTLLIDDWLQWPVLSPVTTNP